MIELHPRYVVDEEGRRTAVVLEVAEYEQLEKQALLWFWIGTHAEYDKNGH